MRPHTEPVRLRRIVTAHQARDVCDGTQVNRGARTDNLRMKLFFIRNLYAICSCRRDETISLELAFGLQTGAGTRGGSFAATDGIAALLLVFTPQK